jgi:hypothetical protein
LSNVPIVGEFSLGNEDQLKRIVLVGTESLHEVTNGFRARFKTPIMAWMMIGMEA